jgi:hypothetical protein
LDALEAQGDDRLRPPPAGNLPPGAAAPYEKDDKGQPIRLSSESAVLPAEEEKPTVPPRVAGEYFVMPKTLVDGWDEWSDEEKAELDDYVRHLLHSRKERFRRSMRGFRRYVRTPLGAFITIYATLLTFWGASFQVRTSGFTLKQAQGLPGFSSASESLLVKLERPANVPQ